VLRPNDVSPNLIRRGAFAQRSGRAGGPQWACSTSGPGCRRAGVHRGSRGWCRLRLGLSGWVGGCGLESACAVAGSDEHRVPLRMPGRSGPANGRESSADEKFAWPRRLLRANRLKPVLPPRVQVPRARPHLREPVRRCRDTAARNQPVHGHNKVMTTLDVYAHLFPDDDATEDMAALGALATGPTPTYGGNVVALRG
jgi:hypothetical protein